MYVPHDPKMTSAETPVDQVEIVVSGMSGRLPQCYNLQEFEDKLYQGVNLISSTDKRFPARTLDLPPGMGVLDDADRFDAEMFNFTAEMAKATDPKMRLCLETAYEAIADAGHSLESARQVRTGVYVGTIGQDTLECLTQERISDLTYISNNQAFLSHWLSHYFDFKGPSIVLDSACSSSSLALAQAVMHIRTGQIDAALVGGVTMICDPTASKVIDLSGALSPDSSSKTFDASANGFCRSEGCMMFYVTKKDLANRIYASVEHIRGNSDGYKVQGMAAPSRDAQVALMTEIIKESGIQGKHVSLAEAHGTGTVAGDGQEANGIAEVLCREKREAPLLITATKSNVGHTEGAAGLTSMAKIIFSMERQVIPPNLHYKTPNPNITCIKDGKVKVVAEPTAWTGGLSTISSYGIGGSNYVALLKSNDSEPRPPHVTSKLPRLLTYCARSQQGAQLVLKEARQKATSVEYQALLQTSSNMPVDKMPYRMYTVLNTGSTTPVEAIQKCGPVKRPLWLVFGGLGSQYAAMGQQLMKMDSFRESIEKSAAAIRHRHLDLTKSILSGWKNDLSDSKTVYCGLIAIQMALYDMLHAMGVRPDGVLGHSLGETMAAYADGSLTREEVMEIVYWRGEGPVTAKCPAGKMAVVDMPWEEVEKLCPKGVYPACHNEYRGVTLSGLTGPMDKFMAQLESRGVGVKEIECFGYPHHTPIVDCIVPTFREALSKVITPKRRSPRWVSTCFEDDQVPEAQWASVEYFNKNVTSPVLFYEALKKIPKDAVVVEINARPLFAAPIKSALGPESRVISLMNPKAKDSIEYFLEGVGKYVPNPHGDRQRRLKTDETVYEIDLNTRTDSFLKDHVINGKLVYPEAGYLVLLWRTFSVLRQIPMERLPLNICNVKFVKDAFIPASGVTTIGVCILKGADVSEFKINENNELAVSGTIINTANMHNGTGQLLARPKFKDVSEEFQVSKTDVYAEFKLNSFEFGPSFQGVQTCNLDATAANVEWSGEWISFLHSMFQCQALMYGVQPYNKPINLMGLSIDPSLHPPAPTTGQQAKLVGCRSDKNLGVSVAGGVVIKGLEYARSELLAQQDVRVDTAVFFPLREESNMSLASPLKLYIDNCLKYCILNFKKICRQDKIGAIENKSQVEKILQSSGPGTQVDLQQYAKDEDCGFARFLMNLFAIPLEKDFRERMKALIDSSLEDIQKDRVLSLAMNNESYLVPALQVVLENNPSKKISVLEIGALDSRLYSTVKDICKKRGYTLRYTAMDKEDSGNGLGSSEIEYVKWDFSSDFPADYRYAFDLVLINNSLYKQVDIGGAVSSASAMLASGGFILVHETTTNFPFAVALGSISGQLPDVSEKRDFGMYLSKTGLTNVFIKNGFEIILQRSDQVLSTTFLLRKTCQINPDSVEFINISSVNGEWMDKVQKTYRKVVESSDEDARLWLYANGDVTGAVGFAKSLAQESASKNNRVRCVVQGPSMTPQKRPELTPSSPHFKQLCRMDLVVNECRDSTDGCHLLKPFTIERTEYQVPQKRAYLTMDNFGDLNTLRYVQRIHEQVSGDNWASVYYSSLAFQDMMIATGKLAPEISRDPHGLDLSAIGTEFVGRDSKGNRIMGYAPKGIATEVDLSEAQYMRIPDGMSMRDASSLFMAYSIAFYALVVKGNIKQGERILIQSGTSCVAQAAIRIALHHKLQVFTTVGTEDKRKYLRELFPSIPDSHISAARGVAFRNHFRKLTNKEGVDITINCLTGYGRYEGMNIVRPGGRYVELKRYKLVMVSRMGMGLFRPNVSFISVEIGQVLTNPRLVRDRDETLRLLKEGLQTGLVKPIKSTVFEASAVKEAFEYFDDWNHIGKILIKFRDEEADIRALPSCCEVPALPRAWCYHGNSYIIVNGLENVGLELADWLVKRGARNLVLTGRNGTSCGYQLRKIKKWEQLGVKVVVTTVSCETEIETRNVIDTALNMAPLEGVFHINPIVPENNLFDQTPEEARAALTKATQAIVHLDALTRKLEGRALKWFVAFTSLLQGTALPGKTSQYFADSVAETVCTKRHADGLHGLALQRRQRQMEPAVTSDCQADQDGYWRFDLLEEGLLMPFPVVSP